MALWQHHNPRVPLRCALLPLPRHDDTELRHRLVVVTVGNHGPEKRGSQILFGKLWNECTGGERAQQRRQAIVGGAGRACREVAASRL